MPHHPDRRPTRTARSLNAGNVDFFMEFVDKGGPRGCWVWLGRKNDSGYGILNWFGKQQQRAHRISYQIHGGELEPADVLRHSCDNPPCVNPAHLQPGTHADNMHDMHRRGRNWKGPRPRGERSGTSKLTEVAVREIRQERANGMSLKQIASRHGVGHKTIHSVVIGKTWGWLDSEALSDRDFLASADPQLRKSAPLSVSNDPPKPCDIADCGKGHYARGWCLLHYARWKSHGDPLAFVRAFEDRTKNRKCDVEGCGKRHHSHGFCVKHLRRFTSHGDPSAVTAPQARRKRLVTAEVLEIRRSSESGKDIAARLGISESLVADIREGRAYTRFAGPMRATTAA